VAYADCKSAKRATVLAGVSKSVKLSKRTVIRLGFGLVLLLLLAAVSMSYRVQRSYSAETMGIYHRRVEQEDLRYRLRRTLLLASITARDFLLDPRSDRDAIYRGQIVELQQAASELHQQLAASEPHAGAEEFNAKLHSFWDTLLRLPETSAGFGPNEKFTFVQTQVVPRRNAVADLLRQFSELAQQALKRNEQEFADTQRLATAQLSAILAGCGLLGFLVVWLSLSHSESLERETAEQNLALARGRAELSELSARLMAIQEEERSRISRELHDEIGQALATLRLEVARAEPLCRATAPAALERLAKAREIAERAMASVRGMSALLRPSLLDDMGLGPAIRWLADGFADRSAIPCHVAMSDDAVAGLSEAQATCVFRVLQESLHNIEKHAQARNVTISAVRSDGGLTVTVEDDGAGFQAEPPRTRRPGSQLGLLGMRERALAVGGALTVASAPGAGTKVVLSLPVGADVPVPALTASAWGASQA